MGTRVIVQDDGITTYPLSVRRVAWRDPAVVSCGCYLSKGLPASLPPPHLECQHVAAVTDWDLQAGALKSIDGAGPPGGKQVPLQIRITDPGVWSLNPHVEWARPSLGRGVRLQPVLRAFLLHTSPFPGNGLFFFLPNPLLGYLLQSRCILI